MSSIFALEPTVCLASITCELRLRVSRLRMPKLPSRHLRLLQRMVPYLHLFCCFSSVACNSSSSISSWRVGHGPAQQASEDAHSPKCVGVFSTLRRVTTSSRSTCVRRVRTPDCTAKLPPLLTHLLSSWPWHLGALHVIPSVLFGVGNRPGGKKRLASSRSRSSSASRCPACSCCECGCDFANFLPPYL